MKSVILFKIAFQRYASPDDFEIYLELCQVTHVNSQISRYGKVFFADLGLQVSRPFHRGLMVFDTLVF